jgi:protein-S-isoprenylcysteine O-methyltransferase Ste14
MSHNAGHLWSTLLSEKGDPHFGPLHIASYVFLGFGFYLLSSAWNVLYHAQRRNALAQSGPYARIRHPQYVAFVPILLADHGSNRGHGASSADQKADMMHDMGHAAGMSMEDMARDMRNRFLVALVFAIPVFVYSPMGRMLRPCPEHRRT